MERCEIGIGFDEGERSAVGALYWAAFQRKLRPAFASTEVGARIIAAALRPERVLVARCEGAVAGVCGFLEEGAGAVDLSWSSLRSALSVGAAVRAAAVLLILERGARRDALVLDGLCVDERWRGRGIGTALLAAAQDRARAGALRAVRLSVVDSNPRAAALYERLGFRAVGGGVMGALGAVYGFDRYTVMERGVAA
ncbi:MAG: GNAT family N-acetyltransferase [Microbacterium sp.]|jgi:ribosomal protein S18 acetylase RimI-like enzyme|uniref:GNAT family N-acetyltransferase n=1 Tax=Microbacterium sp. TaxID=51671 RepID=UPI0028368924|nr:GNAT family N-acetyltransferase [Microbacterium sp.]MDR2323598.1 GNAT family N-acetyltransferase [Microbacterium sp.]